jgi:NH3-dependent NAD+ synthetase
MEQVALFVTSDAFDPFAFEKVIIGFSGGKDSVACVLHCLELGIPKDRIELWHHEIDDGDTGQLKMDCSSYFQMSQRRLFSNVLFSCLTSPR